MRNVRTIVIISAIIHFLTVYSFRALELLLALSSAVIKVLIIIFFKLLNEQAYDSSVSPQLQSIFTTSDIYATVGMACLGILCTGVFLYAFWKTCMYPSKYKWVFFLALVLLFAESFFKIALQIDGLETTEVYNSLFLWYSSSVQIFVYTVSYSILSFYFFTQVKLKNDLHKILAVLSLAIAVTVGIAPILIQYLGFLSFLIELVVIFTRIAFDFSLFLISAAFMWIFLQAKPSFKN